MRVGDFASAVRPLILRHWVVLPVVLLALLLRLRDLDPVTLYGDDAEYGIVASYLAKNPFDLTYPRLVGFPEKPFVSQPPLVVYLFAASFLLFGIEDHNAVYVSVLLGTATVAAVYAIGALWRDRATGFVAATFLAVMPFHVMLSRKALLDAGLTFFMALAAALALAYFRAPSARRATLAGVGAGLALMAKVPGVLVVVVLAAYAAVEALVAFARSRRGDPEADARLRAMPFDFARAAAAALAFPIAWVGTVLLAEGTAGFREISKKFLFHAKRVAGSSSDASTTSQPWEWYLVDPQFGLPTLVSPEIYALAFVGFLLLAVGFLARPVRNRGNLLVLLWVAVVFLFFALADRKVWFYTLPITPGLALAAAYPVAASWRVLGVALASLAGRFKSGRAALGSPPLRAFGAAALAAVLVAATFVPASSAADATMERGRDKFGEGIEEAAAYARAHGGGDQVGTLLGRFAIAYYNPDALTYHWFVDNGHKNASLRTEKGIETGNVRWLFWDDYLNLQHENAWFAHLVGTYDGRLVGTWGTDWGTVRLYEFPS